ncbi:MAG: F0F1 ATP synthase subunit B [Acidaminococcaceae bacterium]|nr:F0F1 ATP synthase subunit B [Acidaminococcaceae bacterium]
MVNVNATFIAQILNFLFLVFILAKFAYKPLMRMMEERKNKIAGDLENAEKAKEEAEGIKAECAAKLAVARQEAQEIIENARKTAQAAHDKIMAETKAEQEQAIASAKEAIAREKQQALGEIRGQVINLSLIAASKIVEQKLGSEEDKKIAGDIVDAVLKQ